MRRLAPGRGSMRKGWPSFCCSFSPTVREMKSPGPPSGYGSTIFTGLDGYSCAIAAIDTDSAATMPTIRLMLFPPCGESSDMNSPALIVVY